jgi:hypothetical protein
VRCLEPLAIPVNEADEGGRGVTDGRGQTNDGVQQGFARRVEEVVTLERLLSVGLPSVEPHPPRRVTNRYRRVFVGGAPER